MKPTLISILFALAALSADAQIPFREASLPPGVQQTCRMITPHLPLDSGEGCINGYPNDPRVQKLQRWQAAVYADANPGAKLEPEMVYDRVHAIPQVGWWALQFYVPRPAYYSGKFEVRDDSSDLNQAAIDAAGQYTSVQVKPKDEIEVIIMEEGQYIHGFYKNKPWSGPYTSGRRFEGEFRVMLYPGWYRIVMNNNFSYAKAKSVTLKLYNPEAILPQP